MSSGGQGRKQELAEYEKDYLERLQKQKDGQDSLEIKDEQDLQKIEDGQNLQNLIFNFSKDLKKPEVAKVTNVDYIGHCTFCMMGVPRKEMTYENGHLFHSNCFEQQGKNFPAPNKELQKQNSSAKVELVQLRNLKIRTTGSADSSRTKPKTKKKSKRKTKKRRPKRRVTKRKKTKKRSSRRKPSKRRTASKRKKSTRKTKRRVSRRTKRKTRRRR